MGETRIQQPDLGPDIQTGELADNSVTDPKVAQGIDAIKIADGSVANTPYQFLKDCSANIQNQLNSLTSNPDLSCKVTKSADQSIPNNTDTIITWDQEDYDTDSMHDNVTNNSRITIKTAGKYSILCQSQWEGNNTGRRFVDIEKNGVIVARTRIEGDFDADQQVTFVGDFLVNDFLEISVNQNSGITLDFRNGITYFEAHKLN